MKENVAKQLIAEAWINPYPGSLAHFLGYRFRDFFRTPLRQGQVDQRVTSLFLKFGSQQPANFSNGGRLGHLFVAAGNGMDSDLPADIRSPGISSWFALSLGRNENQEVTSEALGNEGARKMNVVLIDLQHAVEVPLFEIG